MKTQDTIPRDPPRTDSSASPSADTLRRVPNDRPAPVRGDGAALHLPDLGVPPPSPSKPSPTKRTFRSRRPQKAPAADLKVQYRTTLLVGFALALGVLVALTFVDFRAGTTGSDIVLEQQEVVEMQEIQQTEQIERAPLPPRPTAPIEVPNDQVIEDEPLNLDASLDLNAALDVPTAPPPPPEAPPEEAAAEEEVFVVVEQRPELIGGYEAIYDQIEYPPAMRRAGVEGRVVLQFIVDTEGNVIEPTVLRSPHSMLSEEALRVIQLVRFVPGRQRSRAVNVQMALPITFRLQQAPGR